jgi:hypothetical protein
MIRRFSCSDVVVCKKEKQTKKEQLLRALFIAEHHNNKNTKGSSAYELKNGETMNGVEEV